MNDQPTEIPIAPPGVSMITLHNGLAVIVREDHSAPVVTAQVWCRAGSIDEGKWLGAGLSHVLEHMLFKGTTKRPPGRIDQEVHEVGGYINAYTSFDRTVYWINVPNTGATVAIDVLCDIAQNATLPAEEMAKEKQVILREMDMNQDDPGRRSGRRLFETAYTRSPYRYTIIGYPDIYNTLQPEDVLAYYHAKYAPNNLFFVVVGDITRAAVETQIGQAFGHQKSRPLPCEVLPVEPRQIAPREVIEEAPIELGYVHCAWHIPDLRHPDIPVLDVLATLLGAGRSSRLYQQVREKAGLVESVEAWTYNPGNSGLFGLSAVVEPGKFYRARAALLAEVERMKDETVAPMELAKAVKQFVAATLATRKTMQGQAQELGGSWMVANDLNFSERYLAAVKRITPADLQRAAREYLTPENRTLYALLPKGATAQTTAQVTVRAEQPVQKIELPNGLRLLLKEDHRLPFVHFHALFQGGVLAESAAQNGLTLLLAKMLLKGTPARNAEQIVTEIESVGGSIDCYGGNNSFGVHAEVLSEDFTLGLNLVADVLLNPCFPDSALELERQMQLAAIRAQKDQILQNCGRMMRRALFGEAGYGLDINGTETSVALIQTSDLRAYHHKMVAPNNCVFAIFGDIKALEVQVAVEKLFGAWPRNAAASSAWPSMAPLTEIRRILETQDKKQAVVYLGFHGVTVRHPHRYPLEMVQEACSDLGSRLFLRIRDKLGLAYYVGAQNALGLSPGYFAFYAGTSPDKADHVEREMIKEAELLRQEGLTEEELRRTKSKLIGQKKIARQDLGAYAMTVALDELYGLGFNHIETEDAELAAVTVAQTREVAQLYLTLDRMAIAVIKPEAGNDAGA